MSESGRILSENGGSYTAKERAVNRTISGKRYVHPLIKQYYDELRMERIKDGRVVHYSTMQPFTIGKVEDVMKKYAQENGIELADGGLYFSPKETHGAKKKHDDKGISVSDEDILAFPEERKSMEIWWDPKGTQPAFFYFDRKRNTKFVIHPNERIKIDGHHQRHVNLVTYYKLDEGVNINENEYKKVR